MTFSLQETQPRPQYNTKKIAFPHILIKCPLGLRLKETLNFLLKIFLVNVKKFYLFVCLFVCYRFGSMSHSGDMKNRSSVKIKKSPKKNL